MTLGVVIATRGERRGVFYRVALAGQDRTKTRARSGHNMGYSFIPTSEKYPGLVVVTSLMTMQELYMHRDPHRLHWVPRHTTIDSDFILNLLRIRHDRVL